MKTTIRKTLQIAIAAALLAGVATGATAADVPQVHVRYADLNLRTPAGVAVLDRRITAAAERVCAVFGDGDLAHRAQFAACVTGARGGALAAVKAAHVELASSK